MSTVSCFDIIETKLSAVPDVVLFPGVGDSSIDVGKGGSLELLKILCRALECFVFLGGVAGPPGGGF